MDPSQVFALSQNTSPPPDPVFSKTKAVQLPPHRPWDCAIELLPGTTPPKSQVFPLSIPETVFMEEYIQEALDFFVEKNDGGSRPFIDYWGFNAITVKYSYPLPFSACHLRTSLSSHNLYQIGSP